MSNCNLSIVKTMTRSLEDVIREVQAGALPVGSYFSCTLTDGREVDLVVTAIEDDAVRLETRDCLGKYVKHYKNDLSAFFDSVYKALPEVLRNEIIKTTRAGYNEKGQLEHVPCKLFLPAASEIFPPKECYGDKDLYKQMDYYKDPRNRIRCFQKGGVPDWYWTSSRYAGYTTYWCLVNHAGSATHSGASDAWVAAPVCFRIRKS